jgi:integrase
MMSAVCTHAIRYGWMKLNPIRAVRQSAKRERIPVPLTAEELHQLFAELELRERTLVLVAASTGLRRGELLALQWQDVDFETRTVNVRNSIRQQHLGPVKTEESEKIMPLDEEMIGYLERWRRETAYAQASDWIFASARMRGRQPLWPDSLMRNYIARAAKRAGHHKVGELACLPPHLLHPVGWKW